MYFSPLVYEVAENNPIFGAKLNENAGSELFLLKIENV
jgi:hypothetical protein